MPSVQAPPSCAGRQKKKKKTHKTYKKVSENEDTEISIIYYTLKRDYYGLMSLLTVYIITYIISLYYLFILYHIFINDIFLFYF